MVHFHCMICTIGITKRLFQLLFFFLRGKDLLKKFNRPSGDHQSISFTCISHRLKLARALIPRRCLSFFSYTCKDFFLFFFFFFFLQIGALLFLFFFFGIEWRWNQVSYKKSSFVVTLAYKREMRVTHAHWKIRLKKYTSTVKALSFFFFLQIDTVLFLWFSRNYYAKKRIDILKKTDCIVSPLLYPI